ncbi:MAG TPA: hypothetical protein VFW07_28320 [Parafilimonas sp.]|nr:hypothetical protein [Parafilimonas sp.]
MNIDAEINDYLSKFSEDEKCLLLDLIKKISNNDLNSSIAERILAYNNELEEAVQQIKNGAFIIHEDVLKESDEW